MSHDADLDEYHAFRCAMLNAHFKGAHSSDSMVERLIDMRSRGNKYLLRALEEARFSNAPDDRMLNSIWNRAVLAGAKDVNSPGWL